MTLRLTELSHFSQVFLDPRILESAARGLGAARCADFARTRAFWKSSGCFRGRRRCEVLVIEFVVSCIGARALKRWQVTGQEGSDCLFLTECRRHFFILN